MGASGNYESDTLRLEDFQGNITAYPRWMAQYPTLEADVRALISNLWNGTNPLFLATAKSLKTSNTFSGLWAAPTCKSLASSNAKDVSRY